MRVSRLRTTEDFQELSWFTHKRINEETGVRCAARHIPLMIDRGLYQGILVTDNMGNFISFR